MSAWGNLDNVAIIGTVTVAAANGNAVLGVSTEFTANVEAGDYIFIDANKYQVERVNSDTSLYLTYPAATTAAGATAYIQQGPKYVANANVVLSGSNVYTIQNVYGVDRVEVGVNENKSRGFSHTGWTHYNTYTTTQGMTRHKAEVLVAMSKNFASNAAGALFGVGAGVDASDDTILADYRIIINTQPADGSADTGNAITFLTVAVTDPVGQTLAYQWEENNTVAWATISDAGVYSGTTTNTLSVSDVTGLDGYQYRVVVSGDSGADAVTSDAALLTETTP